MIHIPKTTDNFDYADRHYEDLYMKSNSPINSSCNSDVEDDYPGELYDAKKRYKKITYEHIEHTLSKYYDNTDNSESSGNHLDLLTTYLRGIQLVYKQSKQITQTKMYLLFLSTISITICLSILAPFVENEKWRTYLITSGNSLATVFVFLSKYLAFDVHANNYSLICRQYGHIESALDIERSREVFSNQSDSTVAIPISLNISKEFSLQEAEQRINEIKEYFEEIVPQDIIRLFPIIYNTNIFRFIKKMENYKKKLVIRFCDIKNEIHYITHRCKHREPVSSKNIREKNRVLYLMELKEKTKSELVQCKHTYQQMDELLNKEIRYAETNQSCLGCAGWFRPDYDSRNLTPVLHEYLKLVIPD